MMPIAQIFRDRRIGLGLTQEQAAKAADVSRRTLIDFETGGEGISVRNLNRLLRTVGLELTAREGVPRPTLDELSTHYQGEDASSPRQRVRRKKYP